MFLICVWVMKDKVVPDKKRKIFFYQQYSSVQNGSWQDYNVVKGSAYMYDTI